MKTLTILLVLALFNFSLIASEKEDTLKGVVLERISQFINFKIYDEFKICVYKNDDLTDVFEKLYAERSYKNKPIKIIQVDSINNISDCHILYANQLNKETVNGIVKKVQQQTLLVSQDIDDIYEGFMVAIYFEEKKIKFAINQGAIKKADLKVNYRLLKVASKVINSVRDK